MELSAKTKKDIVEKICSVSSPKQIILFGSYAIGNATEDSDIDIVIIEEEVVSKIKEKRKIRNSLKDIKYPKDILITSEEEYNFYSSKIGSVFKEISEKGEVLWSI